MNLLHGVKSFFRLARERPTSISTIYAEGRKLDQLFEVLTLLRIRQDRLQMAPVNWGTAKWHYNWK